MIYSFILILCAPCLGRISFAAKDKYWNLSPYRIQLHIAIDTKSAALEPQLPEKLSSYLKERILSILFPLWSAEVQLPNGPEKNRILLGLNRLDTLEQISVPREGWDKHIFLVVRSSTTGFDLQCREFDCYTYRWGPACVRQVRQRSILGEQCFDLLIHTFAPLATIRTLEDEQSHVLLEFKGCDLPSRKSQANLSQKGDVFQPLLIRTNSSGDVLAEGVKEVPWTFLTLDNPQENGSTGLIHSGIGNPFRLRRRGRTQHLAIASRHQPKTSSIRFHPRHSPKEGLSGYEVFRKDSKDEEAELLGLTDVNGMILVPPGKNPVTTLFLRSDGQLLSRIPMAPGAKELQEVPVADDPARLRAQSELVSLREQLIDLVAQRSILMRRVRNQIQLGNLDKAEELLAELGSLPDRDDFNQKILSAKNNGAYRSSDNKIQIKIDKLFSSVQRLLGGFLSVGELTKLERELNAARQEKEHS